MISEIALRLAVKKERRRILKENPLDTDFTRGIIRGLDLLQVLTVHCKVTERNDYEKYLACFNCRRVAELLVAIQTALKFFAKCDRERGINRLRLEVFKHDPSVKPV
jgi:hypothetical protein